MARSDEAPESDECFVVAPIGEAGSSAREHSDTVLDAIIRPAAKRCGLRAVRADAISEPGNITEQIVQHLIEARVVVADLTERNPNVFYELAVRQSFGLPVVLVARVGERIPFDLATERVVWLTLDSGLEALRDYERMVSDVESMMRAAISKTHRSPVTRVVAAAVASRSTESTQQALDRLERAIEDLRISSDPSDLMREIRVLGVDVGRLAAAMDNTQAFETLDDAPPGERSWAVLRDEVEGALRAGNVGGFAMPVADVREGDWAGVEVFARLTSVEGRPLTPAEVIPTAERFGLMPEVGRAALAVAREALGSLPPAFMRRATPAFISVNASGGELRSHAYLADLRATGQAVAERGSKFVVEVTEALLGDPDLPNILDGLHRDGLRIAVDDFGTGYSSLSHLRRLPVDILKIDRSFVAGIGVSEHDFVIVRALIDLGQSLALDVVAEGVETLEQLRVLRESGCQMVEGYLFGRPAPLTNLSAVLSAAPPLA